MFKRNVGNKERVVRVVAGLLMIVCGLMALHAPGLKALVTCVGLLSIVTGVLRYCPACALAGRKSGDNCE